MVKSFFWSRKWFWWAYGGGLILTLLSYILVRLSVQFNTWYGGFYDILQKTQEHTTEEFWESLAQFMWIAVQYIIVITIMNFIASHYSFRWRKAITFDYFPRWRNVQERIEGESQRIQEDPSLFAEIIESLGIQAVNALLTLVAFTPVLWALSNKVNFWILKDVPGSLVFVALIVSMGGMTITWLVARKLPDLEYNNQVVEAAFRKELVLAEEDKINRASLSTCIELFTGLKRNYYRLYLNKGYVDLWLNMYSQCMVVVPFIIMGPSLFTGFATLGVMMQVVNSFGEVRSSLAIFINNWTRITKLRSIWRRLHEFENNLDRYKTR